MSGIWLNNRKFYDFTEPDVSVLDIEEVAFRLAGLFRFQGGTRLSVAEHSVRMAYYAEAPGRNWGREVAYQCLMHDAHEAVVVDLPKPMKELPCMDGYRIVESIAQEAFSRRFDFSLPLDERVHLLDRQFGCHEAECLLGLRWDGMTFPDHRFPLIVWTPEKAERAFLEAYQSLKP